jgi:hypothetical protein
MMIGSLSLSLVQRVREMNWFKGWPVTYLGISSLSAGSWINGGADAGLITCGFCLIVSGLIQLVKTSWD